MAKIALLSIVYSFLCLGNTVAYCSDVFKFSKVEYHFQRVKGKLVCDEIEVLNLSNELIIIDVSSSCNCVKISTDQVRIPAGSGSVISCEISFKSAEKARDIRIIAIQQKGAYKVARLNFKGK